MPPFHWEPQLTRFAVELIAQLTARRKHLGYTQNQLCEKIGIADGLIGKWETGLRKPSSFLFFCWVDALQCDIIIKEKDNRKIQS
jgi:transcriptional regulator with XRE-family HTH domain